MLSQCSVKQDGHLRTLLVKCHEGSLLQSSSTHSVASLQSREKLRYQTLCMRLYSILRQQQPLGLGWQASPSSCRLLS